MEQIEVADLIHYGVVDNIFGAVGIEEGGQRFFKVIAGGTECGHHHRFRVTAKIVLCSMAAV